MISPDDNAYGFLDVAPDSIRYDDASREMDDTAMRLASRIFPGARVLDVGCGTGAITEILRDVTGATITGIEPDPCRAQRARSKGLEVLNEYLSLEMLSTRGPYDFVVFADVLEHLPNPAKIVTLATSALKPGGSFLVSVPNAAHIFSRLDLLRGIIRYEDCGIMDATHLRWFTKKSLRDFFERLNLQITFESYTVMPSLPDYSRRNPFRSLTLVNRTRLLRALTAWKPNLFAVQLIIQARKPLET